MSQIQMKSDLSDPRAKLIEMMQHVNFGRIEDLTIRSGEPIFDPRPHIIFAFKRKGDNQSRPECDLADFHLRDEVKWIFDLCDALQNATVHCIEVRSGLPVLMHAEEEAA